MEIVPQSAPMRFFNTAGPVRAEDHYAIPPLKRGNVAEILQLIRDKQYFVLHAPRQTGKTSALIALRDLLNSGGGAPEGASAPSGAGARTSWCCDRARRGSPTTCGGAS